MKKFYVLTSLALASLAGMALHPGWNSSRSNCLPAPQRIPPKSIWDHESLLKSHCWSWRFSFQSKSRWSSPSLDLWTLIFELDLSRSVQSFLSISGRNWVADFRKTLSIWSASSQTCARQQLEPGLFGLEWWNSKPKRNFSPLRRFFGVGKPPWKVAIRLRTFSAPGTGSSWWSFLRGCSSNSFQARWCFGSFAKRSAAWETFRDLGDPLGFLENSFRLISLVI